jgi:hypothetical protein
MYVFLFDYCYYAWDGGNRCALFFSGISVVAMSCITVNC